MIGVPGHILDVKGLSVKFNLGQKNSNTEKKQRWRFLSGMDASVIHTLGLEYVLQFGTYYVSDIDLQYLDFIQFQMPKYTATLKNEHYHCD